MILAFLGITSEGEEANTIGGQEFMEKAGKRLLATIFVLCDRDRGFDISYFYSYYF